MGEGGGAFSNVYVLCAGFFVNQTIKASYYTFDPTMADFFIIHPSIHPEKREIRWVVIFERRCTK